MAIGIIFSHSRELEISSNARIVHKEYLTTKLYFSGLKIVFTVAKLSPGESN